MVTMVGRLNILFYSFSNAASILCISFSVYIIDSVFRNKIYDRDKNLGRARKSETIVLPNGKNTCNKVSTCPLREALWSARCSFRVWCFGQDMEFDCIES